MYFVERVITNGYRCCCFQSWSAEVLEYDQREEALSHIPTQEIPDLSGGTTLDFELLEAEVFEVLRWKEVDPNTGDILEKQDDPKLIAWGILEWPTNAGRSNRYKGTRWRGVFLDKPFEVMKRELPKGTPETLSWQNYLKNLELGRDSN